LALLLSRLSFCSVSVVLSLADDPAAHALYALSLHDALPISSPGLFSASSLPARRHISHQEGRPYLSEAAGGRSISCPPGHARSLDRKSTRLNSSHVSISYAVFCLKKKKHK